MRLIAIARGISISVSVSLVCCTAALAADSAEFFELRVRPVLARSCLGCHADAKSGGLRLDSRESMIKGGKDGPAIEPGKPDDSLLMKAITHQHERFKMPPGGQLAANEIADIGEWIKTGAVWPTTGSGGLTARQKAHWAYQPVRDALPPAVKTKGWAHNSIDQFILAKLEEKSLRPAPPADKRTLMRRASFDLTGLPPSPEDVEAFLNDRSPDAFAKVVDRLLASPRYGERWGKHWLDLVRYADTSGENSDYPIPQAYLYRDYVIWAFNRDLPFDQFVREQIAGDLLGGKNDDERWQRVIATGYLAMAKQYAGSPISDNFLSYTDTVDNIGETYLGLTLKCARCHDHKFDAISNRDYYALYGIFESTQYPFAGSESYQQQENMVYRLPKDKVDELIKPFRPRLEEIATYQRFVNTLQTAVAPAQDALNLQRRQLFAKMPSLERAWAVSEGKPADARIRKYGEATNLGDTVPRGFLQVLGGQKLSHGITGSGRLELAGWLTDPENPLTARVIVNRIWQHHFGTGLVATPSNFGETGRLPTHPELLDYLTKRFVDSGWSIKAMHRLMMLSTAYQLSSTGPDESASADPRNTLLWGFRRRRLDAEEIRDSLLSLSGDLDLTMGGPHPFPEEGKWEYTIHQPFTADYETNRRSVYLMLQRLRRHRFLVAFDGVDPNVGTPERSNASTPLQALYFMNDPFIRDRSIGFARLLLKAAPDDHRRLQLAYDRVFGRPPDREEIQRAGEFFELARRDPAIAAMSPEQRAEAFWAAYLRGLLASNEFIFID